MQAIGQLGDAGPAQVEGAAHVQAIGQFIPQKNHCPPNLYLFTLNINHLTIVSAEINVRAIGPIAGRFWSIPVQATTAFRRRIPIWRFCPLTYRTPTKATVGFPCIGAAKYPLTCLNCLLD